MTTLELTPQEWKETYAAYVEEYKKSQRKASDEIMLNLQLKRLGFVGVLLDQEMKHIKENL